TPSSPCAAVRERVLRYRIGDAEHVPSPAHGEDGVEASEVIIEGHAVIPGAQQKMSKPPAWLEEWQLRDRATMRQSARVPLCVGGFQFCFRSSTSLLRIERQSLVKRPFSPNGRSVRGAKFRIWRRLLSRRGRTL